MADEINFSSTKNKEKYSFDLNNPTVSIEDGGSVPIRVVSSSETTFLIDLNSSPVDESDVQLEELNLDQLHDESEDNLAGDSAQDDHQSVGVTKKNLTNDQRWAIYSALLERSVDGKLKKTTIKEVSDLLSIHTRTVQRVWKRAKDTPTGALVDVSERKTRNCGRKRASIDLQQIRDIPFHRRTTLRTMGQTLGVSHTTLHRLLQEGTIKRHTNALKPYLKEETKV